MVGRKTGFLFPGQGAQYVGMGKEWAAEFPRARRVYEEADEVLGFSIQRICFEGPEEELTQTLNAQPAIFVTSLALFFALQESCPELKPHFVAGLSLGEFSALVAAGSLNFSEGLKLVRLRAEEMEKAAIQNPGAMISVIGLDEESCASIAKEAGVELANLNAPDQFVLSGGPSGIKKATGLAEAKGAKRVIPLKVSGAFHSRLMASVGKALKQALSGVSLRKPQCLFVGNVSGEEELDPERIRVLLGEQVTRPVRWLETMQRAGQAGINPFIELGPGRVLRGLAKRIDPSLEVLSLEKVSDLEQVRERCLTTK